MKLTEKFYDSVRWYQSSKTDLEAGYARQMEYADQFKGSAGYEALKQRADSERAEALDEQKREFVKALRETTAAMRENVKARKISAPTPEQVNILTVLKMCDHLTADEIRQAENSLTDCPLALSVLDELANSHGVVFTGKRERMTASSALTHIDTLERTALAMLRGEGTGASRTPKDEADCLTRFGAFGYLLEDVDGSGNFVNRGKIDQPMIDQFSEMVNGSGEEGEA